MGEAPLLVTALMAGLLGSGHCLAMCASIAGGMAVAGAGGRRKALLFNLARIFSYVLLGALLAAFADSGGRALGMPGWGRVLRGLAALLILTIGIQYLFDVRMLDGLERAGGRLWARLKPSQGRISGFREPWRTLVLGMSWGLLPCGLVYTMLVMAASSGSAWQGAGVMAAFGAGTLPSMYGTSFASGSLARLAGSTAVRRMIGAGLVLLSVWTILSAWTSTSVHNHF